jgi:DNA-binding MarR family transcriptional regulator
MGGKKNQARNMPLGEVAPAKHADSPSHAAARLNPLVHDRVRLAVLTALATTSAMSFIELKEMIAVSDGNLSSHARKLEEAGLIAVTKGFSGRRPLTLYRLTDEGRKLFDDYLAEMERLLARVGRKT